MRNLSKTEKQLRHLQNLGKIFNVENSEMKVICQKLVSIEMNGHKLAEEYCNGEVDSDEYDKQISQIKVNLYNLTSDLNLLKNIYLNGDPRGYFLKLDYDYVKHNNIVIETDWGGYGIFCPKF